MKQHLLRRVERFMNTHIVVTVIIIGYCTLVLVPLYQRTYNVVTGPLINYYVNDLNYLCGLC